MRLALGASHTRLLRQCLVEGLLLAATGGALGVLAAYGGVRVFARLAPAALTRIQATDLDLGVLAFAAGASLVWGLAFSMLPWLEVRRVDLVSALQHGGRATAGRASARLRSGLVVAQVALGVVLMVGAALLARSALQQPVLPGCRRDLARRGGILRLADAAYRAGWSAAARHDLPPTVRNGVGKGRRLGCAAPAATALSLGR